jgi:photosystem II stability/assembly factor-like uncharacterized protein
MGSGRKGLGRALQGVAFVDPDRGWVASFDTLYSTTDGGSMWKTLAKGGPVDGIAVAQEVARRRSAGNASTSEHREPRTVTSMGSAAGFCR